MNVELNEEHEYNEVHHDQHNINRYNQQNEIEVHTHVQPIACVS
jgi:hypothetical protein